MSSRSELENLYRQASYVVDDPAANFVITFGSPNKELHSFLHRSNATTWAFLTAYNPKSQPTDPNVNRKRQSQLTDRLTSSGFTYLHGYGTGEDWEPEPSLLVLDIDKQTAVAIAHEFDQHAILFGEIDREPELVWCDPETGG